MSHLTFPTLYKALTIGERAALLAVKGSDFHFEAALAEKRLSKWKAQPPFENPGLFAARLAQDNLDEATFTQVLGQACPAYCPSESSGWANQVRQAFVNHGNNDEAPQLDGFLTALAPLINPARERLRRGLEGLQTDFPAAPLTDPQAVEAMLFENVRDRLQRIVARTLVLELNVSRLQAALPGATPDQRFASFVEQLGQPARLYALLDEYPVLFRQAAVGIEAWVKAGLELVTRLCADWKTIKATFDAGQHPGLLAHLESKGRNTRRGGRSVVILTFDSGFKIVYKPRSLAMEHHFQELLTWLNQGGHQPHFRLLKLLDRGTYGWVEWLAAAECTSTAAVERFYQRQGAYLALAYALEATDFHLDNIIAVGEYPMLIDLEALFHPRDIEPDRLPLEQILNRASYHSVLRPGLLPEPELGDDSSRGFDLSGLAGTGDQQTPYLVTGWENKGTDTMRLVRRQVTISGGQNLPTLRGQPTDVVAYRQAIEIGFTRLYRRLSQRRDEFLATDGPLARFAQAEIRILPRSGDRYSSLLDTSLHPDLMRDALDRERFLDRLWQSVEHEPTLARLIPYEKADLMAGDIPLFTTPADSRDAYSSDGQRIADFFPQSGLEAARQRISTLSETDLAQQCWFIRAALATVAKCSEEATCRLDSVSTSVDPPTRLQLIALACAIAARLEQLALRAGREVSWLGVALIEDRHWEIGPLDLDLYNGLPGVALLLARLGAVTGQARWTNLARAAVATMQRYITEEMAAGEDAFPAIGALDGLGGLLYSLAQLGSCWPQFDLSQSVAELVATTQKRLGEAEEPPGLAHGVAGCLVGLLALQRVTPALQIQAVAQQYGDYLLERMPVVVSYSNTVRQPFAPFWHGHWGVAWAMLALAELSGRSQFRQAALAMIDETLASEQIESGPTAPGVALGILRTLPYLNDPERRARLYHRLEAALQMTLDYGFGQNHALGHGDLGCLDLLLQASVALNDRPWCPDYAHQKAVVVASLQRGEWVTGVPLGVESPGLMAGMAGIGYGLLRLAEPQQVPSLLALEMPHGKKRLCHITSSETKRYGATTIVSLRPSYRVTYRRRGPRCCG